MGSRFTITMFHVLGNIKDVFMQEAITINMTLTYQCYFCPYKTEDEDQYLRHGVRSHLYLPMFPNEADLERYNLTPQGKPWEKSKITEEEAERRLQAWAEKRDRHRNNNRKKEVNINKNGRM
jgi:hypothetical protein